MLMLKHTVSDITPQLSLGKVRIAQSENCRSIVEISKVE